MIALAVLALLAGPCDFLTQAEATRLLGVPVTKAEPSGPEPDEDTGATRSTCTYYAGQAMAIVMRLDFPSAAAAQQAMADGLEPEKLAEEKATVKPESGVGDKAYLMYTPRSAQYVVVKGATVLTVIVGGTPNPLTSYESQLRTDARAAAGKL